MEIYTDGATSNNGYVGAIGGWAFVIIENNEIISTKSNYIVEATNNICELTAIIEACLSVKDLNKNFIVYSDSSYCINCYEQKWYKKWIANDWINSSKKPVANKELWEKLIPFFEDSRFTFKKVKGHSINKWNNYVDKLAVEAKRRYNG